MDPTAELPALWDIDQLAGYLGVGRRFVYRLTEQRRIRFVRVGGKLRFDPADVAYAGSEVIPGGLGDGLSRGWSGRWTPVRGPA